MSRGNVAALHSVLPREEGVRSDALAGQGTKHRLNASELPPVGSSQLAPCQCASLGGGMHDCCQHVLSERGSGGKQELTFILPGEPTLSWELPGRGRAGLKSESSPTKPCRG